VKLTKDDFDSWDEHQFYLWILDGKELGLIEEAKFYPTPFVLSEEQRWTKEVQLKTKIRYDDKKLLGERVYTADAIIRFSVLFSVLFPGYELHRDKETLNTFTAWFDVKPSVNPKYLKYSSGKTFPLNQKWVYQKYGVYINRVMMKVLFHKTWCPHDVRKGKRIPVLKPWIGTKTKEEIQELIKKY